MKKILMCAALAACFSAFAGNGNELNNSSNVSSGSSSVANSAGGSGGMGVGYGGQGGGGGQGYGGNAAGGSAAGGQGGAGGSAAGGTSTVSGVASGSSGNQSQTTGNSLVIEGGPSNTTATIDQRISGTQTQEIKYSGTQTIKNVPSMAGPNLTTSNDTCMGSSSGAISAPGIGVSLGTTWVDDNCKMLKNSRELWNMGMKAASLALMCTDSKNRDALEMTDFECPQTARERNKANQPVVSRQGEVNYTDPYIRQRLSN